MMVCMILCYLYFIPSKKYPNEQYNIENFGVLMCPLSILIFFFFFFLGPFGVPLGHAHLIKNSPEFLDFVHDVVATDPRATDGASPTHPPAP